MQTERQCAMAPNNERSKTPSTWHERETALSLLRLANARANLAQLEEQHEQSAPKGTRDSADVARAEQLQSEIERHITKASGRFGAGAARARLEEAQLQQRPVLERLGVATFDELREGGRDLAPAVDPTVLDFARRECAEAEKTFLEVAAMVIPEVEDEDDDADGGEVIAAADSFADDDLDLRIEPSAAS